ncbi:MAG: hypothetical protein GY869_01675 [Planctomycetes bacterium]|nr:hypothetical protein [Planctomycetota bacterium]
MSRETLTICFGCSLRGYHLKVLIVFLIVCIFFSTNCKKNDDINGENVNLENNELPRYLLTIDIGGDQFEDNTVFVAQAGDIEGRTEIYINDNPIGIYTESGMAKDIRMFIKPT